jgi:outer membrane lipoprotein-sorting protein
MNEKEESMKKKFSFLVLVFFLLGLMTSPGLCQNVEKILEEMIKAQGGKKVLEKINDTTLSGSFEMPAMGMSGTMTIYQKEPNKMRWDAEFMGMMMTQAFDGEIAWATNPQTGSSQEMPEKMAEDFKRGALGRDTLLNPKKLGITFTYKSKEKIEDKDYLVLEQTFADGYKSTLYVDPKTYLVYKSKGMSLNQMGVEVETETYVSGYREVDGVMIAHSMKIYQDGEEFMTMTINEVTFNSDLEDSLFVMSE